MLIPESLSPLLLVQLVVPANNFAATIRTYTHLHASAHSPPHFRHTAKTNPTTIIKMAANYSTVDYSTADYYGTGTLPMPVPTGGKATAYPYYNSGDSTYSVSPPEGDASVSSGTGGVASYGAPSSYAGGSSYAGSSNGDYDSAASAGNVDLQEYMQDRFTHQFDAVALDRAVATQTKT